MYQRGARIRPAKNKVQNQSGFEKPRRLRRRSFQVARSAFVVILDFILRSLKEVEQNNTGQLRKQHQAIAGKKDGFAGKLRRLRRRQILNLTLNASGNFRQYLTLSGGSNARRSKIFWREAPKRKWPKRKTFGPVKYLLAIFFFLYSLGFGIGNKDKKNFLILIPTLSTGYQQVIHSSDIKKTALLSRICQLSPKKSFPIIIFLPVGSSPPPLFFKKDGGKLVLPYPCPSYLELDGTQYTSEKVLKQNRHAILPTTSCSGHLDCRSLESHLPL